LGEDCDEESESDCGEESESDFTVVFPSMEEASTSWNELFFFVASCFFSVNVLDALEAGVGVGGVGLGAL
jgi:hypothetical protein